MRMQPTAHVDTFGLDMTDAPAEDRQALNRTMKGLLSHQGSSIQGPIVAQSVLESTSTDICIFDNKLSWVKIPLIQTCPPEKSMPLNRPSSYTWPAVPPPRDDRQLPRLIVTSRHWASVVMEQPRRLACCFSPNDILAVSVESPTRLVMIRLLCYNTARLHRPV